MGASVSDAGRKLLAIVVLLMAAFVLFKSCSGFVAAVAWIVVAVVAVVAVVWAIGVLR